MGAAGCTAPSEGYLRNTRRLVDEYGALLIFDGVIIGFRLAPGGAQEYYGAKAGIAVYGKALSSSVRSVGVIGGKGGIIELLNYIKNPKPADRVYHYSKPGCSISWLRNSKITGRTQVYI